MFLWISVNSFLFEENRRIAKVCGIKSDLSVNNNCVFQTGYEPKTFLRRTDWPLKVHFAQSHVGRPLAPSESHLDTLE